jgi:hypothetical protein
MKALVSYQPQDSDFSAQFLGMLEREGHQHLRNSIVNGALQTNGALPVPHLCRAVTASFLFPLVH